jgi:hypothetical protein
VAKYKKAGILMAKLTEKEELSFPPVIIMSANLLMLKDKGLE